jgi:SAM-dependent methyltransferase
VNSVNSTFDTSSLITCALMPRQQPAVLLVASLLLSGCRGPEPSNPPANAASAPPEAPRAVFMSYADARPILQAHASQLTGDLKGRTGADLERAWPAWAAAHDAAIRARLARGDEDSVVNFWLYGTTFTTQPRATAQDLAHRGASKTEDLLIARLDDLVEALAAPGANERLQFARQVIERHGIDVGNPDGQDRARELLVRLRARMIDEARLHTRETQAAAAMDRAKALDTYATIYRERGLSSDTSLAVDFALDRALAALAARGGLGPQGVRRLAIIGPGLDFTDKAEGYDLYPPQTIQPFAVMDSLIRLKLAAPGDLRVTTFDLSPRVNGHLRAAVTRARAGTPYALQLPLTRDDPAHQWTEALEEYWAACGKAIGEDTTAVAVPAAAGRVDMRAVRVRPEVVAAITPEDLNVVVQRLRPMADDDRFDLIIATNVLVYYDAFEQALALANVSAMLRPGGMFLTNYLVHPDPPLEASAGLVTPVFWDRQKNGDTVFGYRYASARRQ